MWGIRDVNKSACCQMFGNVLTGFGFDSLNCASVYVFRKSSGMSLQIFCRFWKSLCICRRNYGSANVYRCAQPTNG